MLYYIILCYIYIVMSTYLWRQTLFLTTPLMEFVSGEKKNTEFVRAYVSGITFLFILPPVPSGIYNKNNEILTKCLQKH